VEDWIVSSSVYGCSAGLGNDVERDDVDDGSLKARAAAAS